MAGIYRQRHPERTAFYRVLFHYFDEFVAEYENYFEREYGCFRPVIQDVVEKYLDFGNPKCGFARIRCIDCGKEFLLYFSCHGRGFCPSCHLSKITKLSTGSSLTSSSLFIPSVLLPLSSSSKNSWWKPKRGASTSECIHDSFLPIREEESML